MTETEWRELVDRLTIRLHRAERVKVYEFSGTISRDLAALRQDIDAIRQAAGLAPSPVEPTWDHEEIEGD
jgi:hypothetical protein